MARLRYIVALGCAVIALYLGATWFFFGSPHPCGILEARQRPVILELTISAYRKLEELSRGQARRAWESKNSDYSFLAQLHQEARSDLESKPKRALQLLHERVWRQSPAECLWHAITWRASNPVPLSQIP